MWAAFAPGRTDASPVGYTTQSLILSEASAAASAARAVSSKKTKPRSRHAKRATKSKRKAARNKRRWQPNLTTAAHRAAPKCKTRKRARRCRAYSPLDEPYVPPSAAQQTPSEIRVALTSMPVDDPPPRDPIHDKPIRLTPPDAKPDIVEREEDIPLIVQIASTLAGLRVEHALTIVETRDHDSGRMSYHIVPGDEAMRTPDQAELPHITLRGNERIVADIHSHPKIKARGRSLEERITAARATHTNLYPGLLDFAAVEKREAVSAILNPSGTVFLLRRIAGRPSVRVIEGAPLPPLEQSAARGLDLGYLYHQGYLDAGAWTRPPAEPAAHAAARDPAETDMFVTPAP